MNFSFLHSSSQPFRASRYLSTAAIACALVLVGCLPNTRGGSGVGGGGGSNPVVQPVTGGGGQPAKGKGGNAAHYDIAPANRSFISNIRLMVLPVTGKKNADGKNPVIAVPRAEAMRNELISLLLATGKTAMVDRGKMLAALKEIEKGQLGLLDPRTAPKAGRALGARKMVYLSLSGNSLTLRMTDIQSLKIEYSRTTSTAYRRKLMEDFAGFIKHQILLHNFSILRNKRSNIQVSIIAQKTRYRDNEPITFNVQVNRDSYLYLLLVQSDGSIYTLFPNADQENNFVRAGSPVTIPDRNSTFIFAAGEPYGIDVVKAVASRKKLDLYRASRIPGVPFFKVDDVRTVERGIKTITTNVGSRDWNSAELRLEITK